MTTSAIAAIAMMVGCATAPKTETERADLQRESYATLQTMMSRDASLPPILRSAAGFAVFPEVGKGGFVVGGAHGRGILYERGRMTGFIDISQASVGAQVGAQTFSQLIVFRDPAALERVKAGKYSVGGNISAVALSAGAAASADWSSGVGVFVQTRGGAMVEASVSGQRLRFTPAG